MPTDPTLPVLLWKFVSRLGDSSVMVPVSLLLALLQLTSNRVWPLALLAAMTATVISKILWMAWGVGTLAFTGFSGHTLMASAVLPILLMWLLESRTGILLGLLLAALVAMSRVALGAHSELEVVTGWGLGALVSLTGMVPAREALSRHPRHRALLTFCLMAGLTLFFNPAPTQDYLRDVATFLAGLMSQT